MPLTIVLIDYNKIIIILKWISSVSYFLWINKVCCEQIESQIVGSLLGFKLHTVYNGQVTKILPLLVYLCAFIQP